MAEVGRGWSFAQLVFGCSTFWDLLLANTHRLWDTREGGWSLLMHAKSSLALSQGPQQYQSRAVSLYLNLAVDCTLVRQSEKGVTRFPGNLAS